MIRVALASPVRTLPRGAGLAYEPKFDGHRLVVLRTPDGVVLQARSGRIVTAAFPDLAAAALRLPARTTLDGEVVVWHAGRTDFALVQRRAAAATAARAAALARSLPASYAAFDVLLLAGLDLRARPYGERRALLVDLLLPLGPPLQPVPMTTDPDLAATWYETLPASGIEGLVVKRMDQAYPAGRRGWRKLRHTDTADAAAIGWTGPARRPASLLLVLPGDDTPVVSSPLSAALRAETAAAIVAARALWATKAEAEAEAGVEAEAGGAGRTGGAGGTGDPGGTVTAIGLGEVPYRLLDPPLTVEVRHTTARHPPPEVLRLRTDR